MVARPEASPDADRQEHRFRITGMDCPSCATKIGTALRRIPGVTEVSVSMPTETLRVLHDSAVSTGQIRDQVSKLGYGITGLDDEIAAAGSHASDGPADGHGDGSHVHAAAPVDGPWWHSRQVLLTLACAAALGVAYIAGRLAPGIERWAFLAALAIGLVPIARRAISAARYGTPFSIEMLMTIAAAGAVAIDATEEAAAVVLLFLIGELLEGVAAGRARASIRGLATLVPKTALIELDGGTTREVPAESVPVGAVVLVRPGDRIAADGTILSGEGSIEEAPVTGESTPRRKGPGDTVFAGTINVDAALRIRVTAAAADNTIARVVRLVEEAQEAKAPTERFIDGFSRYYTPGVVALALAVAVLPPLLAGADWNEWIYKGLAVLLIGCPCALVISTPAAIAAGLAVGARRGLLLKGGAVLETLGRITQVAVDKTGTLTAGKPRVTDVIGFGRPEREVLALAAALEAGSNHPLATAILARAEQEGVAAVAAADSSAVPGQGVMGVVDGARLFLGSPVAAGARAALSPAQLERIAALNDEGKTVSVLVSDGVAFGALAIRDEPRPDAREGVAALKAAGIGVTMLTGDNSRTARAIAADLGIEAKAELLPQDKLRIVRELQQRGGRVAKVGDGINDAPALAAADVGIAMGGGTDVALETADAAILHGRVLDIAAMIELSRRTMTNIGQNITIAIGLKAIFLVTTVLGITGLWPAILADTGATVLVTANALRLLGFVPTGKLGR